jgi:hypothetical protein
VSKLRHAVRLPVCAIKPMRRVTASAILPVQSDCALVRSGGELNLPETYDPQTRRKIDAALKAKIALEALWEQSTLAGLAQRKNEVTKFVYYWLGLNWEASASFFNGIAIND